MRGFGERVHAAMLAVGMETATDLARACGVTRKTAAKWLSLESPTLSAEHLVCISDALSTRMRWLVTGRGGIRAATGMRDGQMERAMIVFDALTPEAAEEWLRDGERRARG